MQSINRALRHIENNLDQEISIKKLAEVSYISPFHMARVFKNLTGYSPIEYVRFRRLTEAARLIAEEKSSILNIALNMGYGSHSAFSKAFLTRFEIPPKDCKCHFQVLKDKFVEPIKFLKSMNITISDPRIVQVGDLIIVGLKGNHENTMQTCDQVAQNMKKLKISLFLHYVN